MEIKRSHRDSGQVNKVDGLKLSSFQKPKKTWQPHTYERRHCHVKGGLLTILCLVVSYVKLFHFLQYRILVESTSDCMTRWIRHLNHWPIWIKENCVQHLFRTYGSLGCFWSFRFHCLLSALLCGSNMCTQVSSSVSKLVITRL